ncbi:MAG: DUF5611 family protein [Candidatus Methanoperedens sp.]|nr:DUF5611 family protein [Candidatus Methanoperedens sp.]MCE8428587.1 DUF5611 family protein [Candidatus Methanoperedens sp.]
MKEYSFKRGYTQDIGRIRSLLEKNFKEGINEENGKISLSFGAFKRLGISIDKKKLIVDSESNKDITDDVFLDTNKRFRVFLEEATGYTSKERLKMAKKEVQEK